MHAKMLCLFALAGLLSIESLSRAESVSLMPLENVKRGQKGYGLTTFAGSTPEKFEFEVIGVSKNFLPKMDIILVKSEDPKVQVSGFWQGMSGSPLFIDGKLVCAFSYGFRFNKRPIGGCTPIKYMKSEGLAPRRLIPRGTKGKNIDVPQPATSLAAWKSLVPKGDIAAYLADSQSGWNFNSVSPLSKSAPTTQGMMPASIPIALSGFSPEALSAFKTIMKPHPFEPVVASGSGNGTTGPKKFQMGGPIAVQFVRGDMSAAATGTVTWVEGNNVLAFGHPMFHSGEIYAPVASAEVHTVIPSAMSAFVMASPLRELGSLTQDRQSTIAADTSINVRMIPLSINLRRKNSKQVDTFNVEVLNNRLFTGNFVAIATMNAIARYAPDKEHTTATIKSTLNVRGFDPLTFIDSSYSSGGAGATLSGSRGLRMIGPLMQNPFAPLEIDSISLDIDLSYSPNVGQISSLRMPSAELIPGQKNVIDVELDHLHAEKTIKRLTFDVPMTLAGSIIKVHVSSGDAAPLDIAPPTNMNELMSALRSAAPGNVYAITLSAADQGAALNGKIIRDLPATALDRLRSSTANRSVDAYRPLSRTTQSASQALIGESSLFVRVADKTKKN